MTALKISLGIILGAIAGYAYYYYIGCNGGSCPLTSNWMITTAYGAAAGLIIALPGKRKQKEQTGDKND